MTSRREFVRLAAASLSLAADGHAKARTADEALHDLIAGNQRFAKGRVTESPPRTRGFSGAGRSAVSGGRDSQLLRFPCSAGDFI